MEGQVFIIPKKRLTLKPKKKEKNLQVSEYLLLPLSIGVICSYFYIHCTRKVIIRQFINRRHKNDVAVRGWGAPTPFVKFTYKAVMELPPPLTHTHTFLGVRKKLK